REQLGMRPLADSDLEHVLVAQRVERNDRLERQRAPRRVIAGGRKEPPVDLGEIGRAVRAGRYSLAPVIAHRRGFPPRPVGGLPLAALLLAAGSLGRPVEPRRLVGKLDAPDILHALIHPPLPPRPLLTPAPSP